MGHVRRWWKDSGRATVWMALVLACFAVVNTPAAGAAVGDASRSEAQGQHFLASDADVYLDLADSLPTSYGMVGDDRSGSMTSRSYADFGEGTGVTLNLALGRDEATRSLADSILDDPEPYLDEATASELAREAELPADRVTFHNGPWMPADVGDRARHEHERDRDQRRGIDHLRRAAVRRQVAHRRGGRRSHIHPRRARVDRSRGAGTWRSRRGSPLVHRRAWRASPPRGSCAALTFRASGRSNGQPGAEGDDPASSTTGEDAPEGAGDASENASAEAMRKAAKRERACEGYTGTIEAATAPSEMGENSERGGKVAGPSFRSGFDQAQSSVLVTSERVASATFREMHQPAFMRCLRTVYSAALETMLTTASLDGGTVDVAVDDLPQTGDDALMATVRIDLPNGRHVITEVVFLRVGGAQGVYTFSTTSTRRSGRRRSPAWCRGSKPRRSPGAAALPHADGLPRAWQAGAVQATSPPPWRNGNEGVLQCNSG